MQALEAAAAQTLNPWPLRRERAAELAVRYPHAAEMLRLYQALVPVQERAYLKALEHFPPPLTGEGQGGDPDEITDFAVDRVIPLIVDATVAAGPVRLRDGVISVFTTADLYHLVRCWLQQQTLDRFESYLARASVSPILEAAAGSLPLVGRARDGVSDRVCPKCGGLPQLSYFALSGEALVTGPRYLVCSRCSNSWTFSRMTCANCGESTGARLPIYQEQERFPHLRVDGCRSCHAYLLTVDLRREPRAVPMVDELAALPLDLYAMDQGLTKITPNLLGN